MGKLGEIMAITRLIMTINILMNLFSFNQPIDYYKEEIIVDNKSQQSHTLAVDINNPRVSIFNALSFGKIYGFEETSEIVKKNKAIAGVNGMFYATYGHHIGLLIQDKEMITMAYSKTPVFALLDSGKAYIGDLNTDVMMKTKDNDIKVNAMNDAALDETWVLYGEIYGRTTRITRKSINYIIKDNKVVDKIVTEEPINIPEDGYVLSRVTNNPNQYDILNIGESINLKTIYTPNIGNIKEAFQSGGWLVKDGMNVAKDYEIFMGNTRIPNPRTVIGITEDNKVIIKVIDGRQSGYSSGISGKVAAEMMIKAGCVKAVYLDGGASSTMVINGEVVNSPSGKEERKVAHSLLIKYRILPFDLF